MQIIVMTMCCVSNSSNISPYISLCFVLDGVSLQFYVPMQYKW